MIKKDILSLPLWEFTVTEAEDFVEEHKLRLGNWFLPQLVAFWGRLKPISSEGGYCIKLTLEEFFSSWIREDAVEDPKGWFRGLHALSVKVPRSVILPGKAYEYPRYSQLVPLILSGFKQNQDIPYSSWNRSTLQFGVDPQLCEAMLFEEKIDLEKEGSLSELIARLCTRSGRVLPANTCASLSHYRGTVLEHVPKLCRTMATQTWLAHPSHRDTTYMVLDHLNWDVAPDPLIVSDVLVKKPVVNKKPKTLRDIETPWD